jgi:hypothetical protein
MEKRLAIVIAVEKYADTRIPTVKYAEADAEGLAKALEVGGSLPRNSRMLNRFVMQLWVRWGQVSSPVVWLAV